MASTAPKPNKAFSPDSSHFQLSLLVRYATRWMNRAFRSYYMNVRVRRFLTLFLLAPLALLPACNRGVRPTQPGRVAPDFTVSDGTTTVNLASYRGRVVLLNFLATWCAPCVAEIPSLIELQRDMPKLVVIGVSVDENAAAYKSFVASHHLNFITVRNPSESVPTLFHTDMWPETYLIDRNGVIRYKFVSNQDWNDPEIRAMIKDLM